MDYDVLVLGAGPGGYVAAIRAAQLGANVALIEERELGGTCLNRGCIPTKVLVENVHILRLAERGADFGVHVSSVSADYSRMTDRMEEVCGRLRHGIQSLLKKNKVEIISGRGKLADRHTIEIQNNSESTRIQAEKIIIATGAEPLRIKDFPFDGTNVLTSDDILHLKEKPQSILVVGGGYIGAEWASIFAGLKTKVTVVEMTNQLLPRSDSDIAKELLRTFKKVGIQVHLETKVESVDLSKDGLTCKLSNGRDIQSEKVLVSIGRSLNSTDIGVADVGITTDREAILIDEHCRTSVPNIFAVGDVTGKDMLAHVASKQGIVAAECATGHERKMNYRVIPACVFTDPEIASVGLTKEECAAKGLAVKESRFPFMALGRAQAIGDTAGWAKIIADAKTGEVLGAHIVGPHASELIAEAALAMSMEATVEEIANTIHAHPTLPEALMEAAESWGGHGIHM